MIKCVENENLAVYCDSVKIGEGIHYTNVYYICDKTNTHVCVMDPAFDAKKIIENLNNLNAKSISICITHGHADHICAVGELLNVHKDANVYIHEKDLQLLDNSIYNESQKVEVEVPNIDLSRVITIKGKFNNLLLSPQISFLIVNMPGHTQGACCFYIKQINSIFTGDTLFARAYGRTDLTFGSVTDMKESLNYLFKHFRECTAYPGHGENYMIKDVEHRIKIMINLEGK